MKKFQKYICFFLFSLLFLMSACSPSTKSKKEAYPGKKAYMQMKGDLKIAKEGKITLKKGEILLIELKSNAGTGYTWNLKESNKNIVNLLKRKVFDFVNENVKKNDDIIVGGELVELLKFQTLKKGTVTLTFKYFRKWEGEKKSEGQKVFEIEVTE